MRVRYGLIGRKLGHSFSPQIHREMGEYEYELIELEPEEVGEFLKNGDFRAINVTIPYKQAVIPYLDEVSGKARRIGSVNTVVRGADGKLRGYNTDDGGFRYMLRKAGIRPEGEKCLVLGSGGASKTAVCCLRDMGAREVRVISRGGEDNYTNLSRHRDAGILVNATPVGMYPGNGEAPLKLEKLPNLKGVADMIYNPARTALLLEAEKREIRCINGLPMLVEQAREAVGLFLGKTIPEAETDRVIRILQAQTMNIVVIGMPGCGKTTVGRRIAEKTGRPLIDTDAMIEAKTGMSCTDLLRSRGEAAFREIETEILLEAGKKTGMVLVTGDGVVIRPENRDALRQNGRLFWLNRPMDAGMPDSRQSQSENGEKRELPKQERRLLYEAWADVVLSGMQSEQAAEEIIRRISE